MVKFGSVLEKELTPTWGPLARGGGVWEGVGELIHPGAVGGEASAQGFTANVTVTC